MVHDLGGSGPPAVMAHAAGLHGLVWRPLAGHLASALHCHSFDHRGHGDTPAGGPVGWEDLAADVVEVVEGLGPPAPSGVGHSGGATALLMAEASRPGLFRALYCYEPVAFPDDGTLPLPPVERLVEGARRRRAAFPSRQAALESFAARPPLAVLDPGALRAYVEHGFTDGPEGTVRLKCHPDREADLYRLGPGHRAWDLLAAVGCDVTVACGDQPGGFGERVASAQAGRLVRGRVEVLSGLGHFGPLQDPARVAGSVLRSLL